jgi:hypothetical protein
MWRYGSAQQIRPRNLSITAALKFTVLPSSSKYRGKPMLDPSPSVVRTDVVELGGSAASWPAIVAGAVASAALTFLVLSFGAGLGLSVVSPWGGAGVSATTFKIGTGLFLIVIAMLSSSIGGYLAGRLRTKWDGIHSDEVYFRDTAHGFLAWALATVVGLGLLAAPASGILGNAVSGVSRAATDVASQSSPIAGYVDALLRSDNPQQQEQGRGDDARDELTRMLFASKGLGLDSADSAYAAKIVASRTGLTQADAQTRVTTVLNQAKTDLDNARKAAAQLAFWLTASLVIGAFCASLAATEGGAIRDGTWRK